MTISHAITKSGHYCHTKTMLIFQLILLTEFLICFEAWVKFAQQWLVCVELEMYLEPINK